MFSPWQELFIFNTWCLKKCNFLFLTFFICLYNGVDVMSHVRKGQTGKICCFQVWNIGKTPLITSIFKLLKRAKFRANHFQKKPKRSQPAKSRFYPPKPLKNRPIWRKQANPGKTDRYSSDVEFGCLPKSCHESRFS